MGERQTRRVTGEPTPEDRQRIDKHREEIARELPDLITRDQMRRAAREEPTLGGELRRAIHAGAVSLPKIADQIGVSPLQLDQFLTGEAPLPSDAIDRLTALLGYELTVRGLTREYPSAAGPLRILRGVDLRLRRGEALAVTGPSGSGKSTLLYIVGLLDRPSSGTVRLLGQDPFALSPAEQARCRNAHIGFIFQDHHLLPQCTVLENVLIPTLAGSGAGKTEEQRARGLLERVGLGGRLTHRPAQLSGGEKQRVAVCRALINQPELLLADEPTGNLDRATADAVGDLLLELSREQNVLLICVTHSTDLAARFPLRLELRDGRLTEQG